MALYAFDGTWNSDKPGSQHDTNVLWFKQAYSRTASTVKESGRDSARSVRPLAASPAPAATPGCMKGMQQLAENVAAGDADIDVVGFSRGAALAVDFCNRVNHLPGSPTVRFLGVWDCVPSFGIASVDSTRHGSSICPTTWRSATTRWHSTNGATRSISTGSMPGSRTPDAEGRLFEVWFRGVHSDVGGGNNNPALSSIALNWMLRKAASCGLPIDAGEGRRERRPDEGRGAGLEGTVVRRHQEQVPGRALERLGPRFGEVQCRIGTTTTRRKARS